MKPCAKPIDYEKLAAWWLNELEDEAVEEHLLGCAWCAKRAESLAAYAQGIRAAVRNGAIDLALTPRFLEFMKQQGMRLREYPAQPGDTVHCTIRAEDDAVVSRFKASLAGVRRVDVLHSVEVGGAIERWREEDVPFDPEAGEVLLIPSTAELRKMPAFTSRVQLVAVDDSGERSLGEYTFAHSP
jgi:hypothetical protein